MAVRGIILNKEYSEMSPVSEMLLYVSARVQLINEVVRSELESGKTVISGSFMGSSLAYQEIPRGLGVENIYEANLHEIDKYMQQVTFLLDLPSEVGIMRKKKIKRN